MRRLLVAAAVVAAALALPTLAAAKGPASASITGPGLQRALALEGGGELGSGTALGTLVDAGGFFPQLYGQSPDPTLKNRPRGSLGPRFRVVYVVPGPNGIRSRVAQDAYPYASGGPVTHMKAGQSYWHGRKAHGGWFRASVELRKMLVRAGLPRTAAQARAGA
jgi:hypothetical protein